MAPSATAENGAGGATDEVHPPAGVVIPPRDIRVILEKTAVYVARNGPVFEGRIREKEKTNQKFGFLGENDAYNAFYLWRLEEIREGRGGPGTTPGGRAGGVSKAEAAAAAEEEEAARKAKGPPRPPDFEFSARVPRINRKDLDVLQLTALHVARHGRGFMNALAQREAGNPQFAFLVPNHTFHNYFQSLTEQYVSLIRAAGGLGSGAGSGPEERRRVAELREKAADRLHTLKLAKQRAEWDAHQKAEKQRRDEEELLARYEYALVDWNDFVVVETIVFTEADNDEYLPPPTTLGDLEYASLEDKNNMSISANMRLEEAMPTDEDNPVYYNAYPVPQLPQQPQQPPDYGPVQPAGTASAAAAGYYQDEDEADRIREREEQRQRLARAQADAVGGIAPMKIRDNYIPRAAQGGANASRAPQMAICPNCKQQIPINELDAHMRSESPFLSFIHHVFRN